MSLLELNNVGLLGARAWMDGVPPRFTFTLPQSEADKVLAAGLILRNRTADDEHWFGASCDRMKIHDIPNPWDKQFFKGVRGDAVLLVAGIDPDSDVYQRGVHFVARVELVSVTYRPTLEEVRAEIAARPPLPVHRPRMSTDNLSATSAPVRQS